MAMREGFPMTSTCVASLQPWVGFHQRTSPLLPAFYPKRRCTTTKCAGQAWKAGSKGTLSIDESDFGRTRRPVAEQ
jgi:hypothetical protein